MSNIESIQNSLLEMKLDGWLFCSFRGSDPFAPRILCLGDQGHTTRRWFCFIPAKGLPIKIVHAIEKDKLDAVTGETIIYSSWQKLHEAIKTALGESKKIAMQYSPMNDIPYVSCVDGGTIDLVRSMGLEVASSAELIAKFEAVFSDYQTETHIYASKSLRKIVDATFSEVGRRLSCSIKTTEYDIQQYILSMFEKDGLITSSAPVAAVNENTANPHYEPTASHSREVKKGDFLLIDLWGKKKEPSSVYADITWTAFLGEDIPDKYNNVFSIVRDARDAAFNLVYDRIKKGEIVRGFEVDDAARNVITQAGYGKYFIHRTGHSIGEEVHGPGTHIDNLETRDSRIILPSSCFSLEPGIYLEGDFGIRTEIDVYIDGSEARSYGLPHQEHIVSIV